MAFWAKSRLVFNCFYRDAKQSIREVAQKTGFSKSRVHCLKQTILRRGHRPESWFWETDEGHQWLGRLVVATLYCFGLKRGVGAETMNEFFMRLDLHTRVGSSPATIRTLLQGLERTVIDTAQSWEQEGVRGGQGRDVIGAVDETFFEQMMLVFIDLPTGYILLEETAEDRSYAIWNTRVQARLEALQTSVHDLVSDRAKALSQWAQQGLACLSVPD